MVVGVKFVGSEAHRFHKNFVSGVDGNCRLQTSTASMIIFRGCTVERPRRRASLRFGRLRGSHRRKKVQLTMCIPSGLSWRWPPSNIQSCWPAEWHQQTTNSLDCCRSQVFAPRAQDRSQVHRACQSTISSVDMSIRRSKTTRLGTLKEWVALNRNVVCKHDVLT